MVRHARFGIEISIKDQLGEMHFIAKIRMTEESQVL